MSLKFQGTTTVTSVYKAELLALLSENSTLYDPQHIPPTHFPSSDFTMPVYEILKNNVLHTFSEHFCHQTLFILLDTLPCQTHATLQTIIIYPCSLYSLHYIAYTRGVSPQGSEHQAFRSGGAR